MRNIVVVNKESDWDFGSNNIEVVSAKTYVTNSKYAELRGVRICNMCRSYRYQSTGYYVSLLAEARGHKVFPNITTIQDLKSVSLTRTLSDELDDLIQEALLTLTEDKFTLNIYFGHSFEPAYDKLASKLYGLFPCPLLCVHFSHKKKWALQDISAIPINEIAEDDKLKISKLTKEFFNKKRHEGARQAAPLYDLAILINPEDTEPPSDKKALQNFVDAAENAGFSVEFITKDDYSRIPYFDALFIRDTTSVNHYTYRFARRAHAEGMVVLDDPDSIVKCTNKVYLTELLHKARIATPKTLIVHKDNTDQIISELGLPCVLKQPDSAMSRGVIKVHSEQELEQEVEKFLARSDLIVCQEYIPTEFDWRIGIIDRMPFFACKYYMVKGHWQIYKWDEGQDKAEYCDYDTFPIDAVPEKVLKMAMRAANQIGDGFYGVDLKQVGDKVYIIEVNDNPNIDSGIEDKVLKDRLYKIIMQSFLKRLENKRQRSILYPELQSLLAEQLF